MPVQVRELASRDEARAVLAVNAAAWRAAYDDVLPAAALPDEEYAPAPERVEEFYAAARRRAAPVLVAVTDGSVVGFVELRWGDDDTAPFAGAGDAEVKALYVAPERWRSGVGSRLLREGVARVPGSIDRVVLQTFRENDAARSFYEDRGFVRVGSHEFSVDGEAYPTVVYARVVEA